MNSFVDSFMRTLSSSDLTVFQKKYIEGRLKEIKIILQDVLNQGVSLNFVQKNEIREEELRLLQETFLKELDQYMRYSVRRNGYKLSHRHNRISEETGKLIRKIFLQTIVNMIVEQKARDKKSL